VTRTAKLGVLILSVALATATPALAGKSKADKEREEIRKKSRQVLSQLYAVQPGAAAAVGRAAGYAVFSNFGMKILVAGGGSGKGMAVENATKQQTFMKMVEVQAGLGFGVKKFSLVWVFETPDALRRFVDSGWELGAQTSVAAKAGDQGASFTGALSVSPGVWLYQLTDTGLALELTAKGTKYYKDSDLN
jgi:lipid-binding SYLF domain-containing protein